MISLYDLHTTIGLTLNTVLREYYKVYYEPISSHKADGVVKVSLVDGAERTAGRRQSRRTITFDIAFIPLVECYKTTKMMAAFERIKATFLPYFKVKDRFLKPIIETRFVGGGLDGFGIMVTFDYLDTLEHIEIDDDLVIIDKEDEVEIEKPDGTVETVPVEKMLTLYLRLESE